MIAAADVDSVDITRMHAAENFDREQNRSTRSPRAAPVAAAGLGLLHTSPALFTQTQAPAIPVSPSLRP
jgi:hypothetical protein